MISIDRESDIEWLDEQLERRDKRRRSLVRLVALILVIAFIPLAFSSVLYLLGLPSLRLLIESRELSSEPAYLTFRSAVVAVRADNRQGTGFAIQIPMKPENEPFSVDAANPPPQGLETVVITNHHIIQNAKQVEIGLKSDDFHLISEWKQWPALDLALIHLTEPGSALPAAFSNLTTLNLADETSTLEQGDPLIVIGNPLGLFQITTQASYIGQTTLSGMDGTVLMIRGPVFRGNSGSPVIDEDGMVIGIVFAVSDDDNVDFGGTLTRGSILTAAKDRISFLLPVVSIREQIDDEISDTR